MMRSLFAVLLFLSWMASVAAQDGLFWTPLNRVEAGGEPWVNPAEGRFYALAFPALVTQLKNQPEGSLWLPDPDGRMRVFRVRPAASAEPGFYAKFPEWGTYKIYEEGRPHNQGRVDHTISGFHAQYTLEGRTVLIDPAWRFEVDRYAVYFKDAYWGDASRQPTFSCGQHELPEGDEAEWDQEYTSLLRGSNQTVDLLRYRIAIATTGEYSQFHGGTKPLVLAELLTAVNRLNSVMERDLGLELVLIEDNDKIIFLNAASDGYTNGATDLMINENPSRIGQFIPLDAYEVGHVFGTATSGNLGLAQLSCVCTNSKARGVSGYFTPKFDPFYLNVVAHELGHQYSATHSFNKCINENPGTGWEPGSGSTIMSYAGSCGINAIKPSADDYYHGGSLRQMKIFTTMLTGSTCPERVPTENYQPEVTLAYNNNAWVPILTPLKLEATVQDANADDALTVCWEGIDTGPVTDAGSPVLESPLFRSYPAVAEAFRILPRMNYVLQNQYYRFEHLPDYDRELNFRVTVRDNNVEAGSIVQQDVRFRATSAAGPFRVTSFTAIDTVRQGDYVPVTWDVAGTNQAPVSTPFVNIRLSTDGGMSFPHLLAENVPNEGSYQVTIPKVAALHGRVMVEAVDNIFFQINTAPLRVLPATVPGLLMQVAPVVQTACIPEVVSIRITTDALLDFNEPVNLSVAGGLPPGAVAWFEDETITAPATTTLIVALADVTKGGEYNIEIRATSAGGTLWQRPARLIVVRNDYSSLAATAPESGASGVGSSPVLRWIAQEDADRYDLELATSPAFGSAVFFSASGLTDTFVQLQITLDPNQLYFWRVTPENICGRPETSPIFAFHTETLNCTEFVSDQTIFIPGQGAHVIESVIQVPALGTSSSVWVPKIVGSHQNIGQLRATLKSPLGTAVRLFSLKCFTVNGNINMGFNDESLQPFMCPPDKAHIYRSEQKLSALAGQEVEGPWTLVLEDLATGSGGNLNGWTLSLCSNSATANPYFIRNNPLVLAPSANEGIDNQLLLVYDQDNQPWQLTYTVVRAPLRGQLILDGVALQAGARFTQQDIYDGLLRYQDGSGEEGSDDFLFTVQDGEGGWLGIETFQIRTDALSSVANPEGLAAARLHIWPNPARSEVWVDLPGIDLEGAEVRVFNVLGQPVMSTYGGAQGSQRRLDVHGLSAGWYIVELRHRLGIYSAPLQISR